LPSGGVSEWNDRIDLKRSFAWLQKFVSEEGSVKLRVEVTESLEIGNIFCTTNVGEDKTNLDTARSTRSTNTDNLARDNLIRDFDSLLGDERTADLKLSVVSSGQMGEEKQVKVFCGHKAILSGMFIAAQFKQMFLKKSLV